MKRDSGQNTIHLKLEDSKREKISNMINWKTQTEKKGTEKVTPTVSNQVW